MSFVSLPAKKRGAKGATPVSGVRIAVARVPSSPRLLTTFRIGGDIATRLGVSSGDRVNIFSGEGSDAGKVAIVPDARGEFTLFGKGRTLSVNTTRLPATAPHSTRSAPYTIQNGALVITVTPGIEAVAAE